MLGSLRNALVDPLIDATFEFDDGVSVLKGRNVGQFGLNFLVVVIFYVLDLFFLFALSFLQ
jgi:hypothetical protein